MHFFDDERVDDAEEGLFSNVIIDDPLLESIDPEDAAERFPRAGKRSKIHLGHGGSRK
jgi:hypothetical protein